MWWVVLTVGSSDRTARALCCLAYVSAKFRSNASKSKAGEKFGLARNDEYRMPRMGVARMGPTVSAHLKAIGELVELLSKVVFDGCFGTWLSRCSCATVDLD